MSGLRILVADDESIIRMDLREAIVSAGHEVVAEACDGREAVALARERVPDVVVMDVKMPGATGIDAAREIALSGIAPVVLVSSFLDRELAGEAREAGVYVYLSKPFKDEELLASLEVARARFDAQKTLEREVADLRDQLETRKAVERAKGLLMTSYKLTESEAYRLLQKQSMEKRSTLRQVAEDVIARAR